jgi:hypothetical protein
LARVTVRPFTEKQIELVSTFANQAVIAMLQSPRVVAIVGEMNPQRWRSRWGWIGMSFWRPRRSGG